MYLDLPERIPVYAPNGERVGYASDEQAARLIAAGDCIPLGTKNRIRSIRLHKPPTGREQFRRRPQRGDAHRRETYYNPRGCWTHDFLPGSTRDIYVAVAVECIRDSA